MCRAVSQEEYNGRAERRVCCICKGFDSATWECARYWLENRMLPMFTGGRTQDGLMCDQPHQIKETYIAFFEDDFLACGKMLTQVPLLGDDVVLSKHAGRLIIVARVICPDLPPHRDGNKRRAMSYPPPLIVYVLNPLAKFRKPGLSEDARLGWLLQHQLYYTTTFGDACWVHATGHEHPTHFLDPKRYKHMVYDDGSILEFRSAVPSAEHRILCKPTGLPKTQLQVVATKSEADYFDGTFYYKKKRA